VTAIICPNNLRLIIICRLGTCVRSIFSTAVDQFHLGREGMLYDMYVANIIAHLYRSKTK
jgi:hypothetical protein